MENQKQKILECGRRKYSHCISFCKKRVFGLLLRSTVRLSVKAEGLVNIYQQMHVSWFTLTLVVESGIVTHNWKVSGIEQVSTPMKHYGAVWAERFNWSEHFNSLRWSSGWRTALKSFWEISPTRWSKFVNVLSLEIKHPYSGWPRVMMMANQPICSNFNIIRYSTSFHCLKKLTCLFDVCSNE